jgi:hypothetical protein
MKIFVSGQINDTDFVKSIQTGLISAGHEITHDWTKSDVLLGTAGSKLNNLHESGLRAKNDIQGVIDADVYVLCSSNKDVGKGMYVELGAALALAQSYRTELKIFVLGRMNHLSVFYLHPLVCHVKDYDELVKELGKYN